MLKLQIEMWHNLLGDLEFSVVEKSLAKYALESQFPPSIADIRKRATEIMTPQTEKVQAEQAWGIVLQAIKEHGWCAEPCALKMIGKFSPIAREIVEFFDYQELCRSENQIADRARFIDAYNRRQQTKRDEALLPEPLRQEINRIGNGNILQLKAV